MTTVKEQLQAVIKAQPDDASYEEIMRALAFDRMIARGMAVSRAGRVIDNSEMERKIRRWQD